MTYQRRYIDVFFTSRGGPGAAVAPITFNGRGKYALRTSARVIRAGGFNLSELQLDIRGLSLSHINQLSTYGALIHPNYNYKVQVDAGDDENGMSTIFIGDIQQAWADMKAMPDVPFHVLAVAGGYAAQKKENPTSFEGGTDVVTMLQQLAGKAGLSFRNYGVNGKKIDNPYYWGSPWKQMKEIIDHGGIDGIIEHETLSIWPKTGGADGNLLISPRTGLRDYPAFIQFGVQVRYEFHRAIEYRSIMTIESDITPATGPWRIIRIDYDLQANFPRGNWYAILDGAKLDAPVEQLR